MKSRRVAVAFAVVVACGNGEGFTPVAEPASSTAEIVAADGGTLELDDGARVVVPVGALAQDGEVTLERVCPLIFTITGFGGCRYELRAGAEVVGRLEVSLPGGDADATCVLANTEDGWRCVGDSRSSDGGATATVTRTAALTTRSARPDDSLHDDTCTDFAFEPCGGDVLGEWSLVRACGTRKQVTGIYSTKPEPYESCGEDAFYRAYPYTVRGTLSFSDQIAEIGGTAFGYSRSGGGSMYEHEVVTEECLRSIGESCHELCTSDSGVCECIIEEGGWDSAGGGSYEIRDGALYFDDADTPTEYCVSGDELVIQYNHPDGPYHVIYGRK